VVNVHSSRCSDISNLKTRCCLIDIFTISLAPSVCQPFSDEPMTKYAWRLLASNVPLGCPAAGIFAFDSIGFGNRFDSSCQQQTINKLEGTHRVRYHADDWLRYLANVNEARTKHPRNRRRLETPHSECQWIVDLCMKKWTYWPSGLDLLTLKASLRVYPCTEFEDFWIIRFWVIVRTDRRVWTL